MLANLVVDLNRCFPIVDAVVVLVVVEHYHSLWTEHGSQSKCELKTHNSPTHLACHRSPSTVVVRRVAVAAVDIVDGVTLVANCRRWTFDDAAVVVVVTAAGHKSSIFHHFAMNSMMNVANNYLIKRKFLIAIGIPHSPCHLPFL